MSRFEAKAGDTFASVSRSVFGTEAQTENIRKSNIGVNEPFASDISLNVPKQPQALNDVDDGTDEVNIIINGSRFRFWNRVEIERRIDGFDTVRFDALFQPQDVSFRNTFKPFTYAPVQITVGGRQVFDGSMVSVSPKAEANSITVSVECYARAAILNDCTSPITDVPFEYSGQTLEQIATNIAQPFGIGVEFEGEAGATFDRVSYDAGKKCYEFIADLAKIRGRIISNNRTGDLFFPLITTSGKPVAVLGEQSPVMSVSAEFNPQQYYSDITAVQPATLAIAGEQYTVKNPLASTFRPLTFVSDELTGAEVQAAAEGKIGRMFAEMVSYNIGLSSWRDSFGDLWQAGKLVKLTAPSAMIYNPYIFMIRSVVFVSDSESSTVAMNIIIPDAFDNKVPERLPWT